MMEYPLPDIRKEAVVAAGHLCSATYKLAEDPAYANCGKH